MIKVEEIKLGEVEELKKEQPSGDWVRAPTGISKEAWKQEDDIELTNILDRDKYS